MEQRRTNKAGGPSPTQQGSGHQSSGSPSSGPSSGHDRSGGDDRGGDDRNGEDQKALSDPAATRGAPLDVLKAHYSALEAILQELAAPGKSIGTDRLAGAFAACLRHMELIDGELVPVLEEAGAADEELRQVIAWHDVAKILLAELYGDLVRQRDHQARQTVFVELMTSVLEREQKAGTGLVSLASALDADLSGLVPLLRAGTGSRPQWAEITTGWTPPELTIFRLEAFGSTGGNGMEENAMNRDYNRNYDRDDRQDYGSRASGNSQRGDEDRSWGASRQRSGSSGREDDDRRSQGRYSQGAGSGYGRGYGEDDEYRTSERGYGPAHRDDGDRRFPGSGRGASERGSSGREDQRYFGRDDDNRRSPGRYEFDDRDDRSRSAASRPRDEHGRFVSDNDDEERLHGRFRTNDDDDDEYGRAGGGYSGAGSRRGSYDDEGERGGYRGRSGGYSGGYSSSSRSSGYGASDHGGWFGDREGHSEAARRGWEGRRR